MIWSTWWSAHMMWSAWWSAHMMWSVHMMCSVRKFRTHYVVRHGMHAYFEQTWPSHMTWSTGKLTYIMWSTGMVCTWCGPQAWSASKTCSAGWSVYMMWFALKPESQPPVRATTGSLRAKIASFRSFSYGQSKNISRNLSTQGRP